jgi:hypothetical protein
MPGLPTETVIDRGLCDLGIVHRTKFDVHDDWVASGGHVLALCNLWLERKKLIKDGTVTCLECLAAPPGCR